MQERRQALADATIDGEGGALAGLTAEELLGLFAKRERSAISEADARSR